MNSPYRLKQHRFLNGSFAIFCVTAQGRSIAVNGKWQNIAQPTNSYRQPYTGQLVAVKQQALGIGRGAVWLV